MPGSEMSSAISEGRGDFRTLPFDVGRFVVMSSRDSVGGGPYLVEEAYPLGWRNSLPSLDTSSVQPARNN
jgi:2'-5' RNA ligase